MSRIGALLKAARARLGGSPEAAIEAEILLAHLLEKDRTWLRAWDEREIPTEQVRRYQALIERRLRGEPVAHLTGRREFWSLPLEVDRHTLIPRPETEHLVAFALGHLPAGQSLRVADLGTGSGAIALALAAERPAWRIVATDRNPGALARARRNAARLDLPVAFVQGDWLAPLAGPFDLIIANPPYIPEGDPHLERGDLRFEPRTALAGGSDGLEEIRRIIAQAPARLAEGGWLVIEHGHDQGPAVRTLLAEAGLSAIGTGTDLAGHERFAHARRPAARTGRPRETPIDGRVIRDHD